MNYGLVLAGGAATRLPNKPLLPLKTGNPVIISGINLLLRSGFKPSEIYIIVPPKSAIPHVLEHYTMHEFNYIVQPIPDGVPKACSLMKDHMVSGDKLYVVYSDNVYSKSLKIDLGALVGHTILCCTDATKSAQLSKYCNSQWVEKSSSMYCIAGYMILDKEAVELAAQYDSTTMLLNVIGGMCTSLSDHDWWDIGTVETYLEYWK